MGSITYISNNSPDDAAAAVVETTLWTTDLLYCFRGHWFVDLSVFVELLKGKINLW
jgi:hypothetical protein